MRRICACFIFILAFCAMQAVAFEAGTGKADITGPVGAPLNGYGDRIGRSSTGIHDPLWARALYLNDGKTGVFLVNCDLTVISRELRAKVVELAPQVVPATNIILTATHTHNAQGAIFTQLLPRFVGGRYMPEVLESTAQGIVKAMQAAYDSRQRATIGYTTVMQKDLSSNRRFSGGPIDEQVGVIRVDNADGSPITIVANFAAHPTSTPDEEHLSYSADYPGFYYNELEQIAPAGCMAMFFNGTEGNQTIAAPPNDGGAWGRTEAVGKLLAQRVYKAAEGISCVEVTLTLNTVEATLPLTLASSIQPKTTLLTTLEFNDLLMCFFPGEAVVDIGLELRKRALEIGYKAVFNVGLTNDYLMYFVPREFYHQVNYEASMNFFGPDMADWFYKHFLGMASKATPPKEPDVVQPPHEGTQLKNARNLILEGDGYHRGVQRALAFQEELNTLYEERVVKAIRNGVLLPKSGSWGMLPPFMDPVPLALPVLGMAMRPLLEGISPESFDELRGMAEGMGKPFDAVWLLENAVMLSEYADKTGLFNAPLCTSVAVLNGKAQKDALLVGRTMDWRYAEKPLVVEAHPEQGHSYVQVGFVWNTGVFNGMNDAGVVICVERMRALGEPSTQGPTMECLAAEWLQGLGTVGEVAEAAKLQKHLRGYHVMVAGMDKDGSRAVVVEYGEQITVRETAEDSTMLLGALPEDENVDMEARSRYTRAAELLAPKEAVDAAALGRIMQDAEGGGGGMSTIWNEYSQFSIVFIPNQKRFMLSVSGDGHKPGAYEMYQLGGGAKP